MKGGRMAFAAAMLISWLFVISGSFVLAKEAPRITKEEALKMVGNPDVIIIDVRQGTDWKLSKEKIRGAVREDPDEIDSWMKKYPKDKTLIFY